MASAFPSLLGLTLPITPCRSAAGRESRRRHATELLEASKSLGAAAGIVGPPPLAASEAAHHSTPLEAHSPSAADIRAPHATQQQQLALGRQAAAATAAAAVPPSPFRSPLAAAAAAAAASPLLGESLRETARRALTVELASPADGSSRHHQGITKAPSRDHHTVGLASPADGSAASSQRPPAGALAQFARWASPPASLAAGGGGGGSGGGGGGGAFPSGRKAAGAAAAAAAASERAAAEREETAPSTRGDGAQLSPAASTVVGTPSSGAPSQPHPLRAGAVSRAATTSPSPGLPRRTRLLGEHVEPYVPG